MSMRPGTCNWCCSGSIGVWMTFAATAASKRFPGRSDSPADTESNSRLALCGRAGLRQTGAMDGDADLLDDAAGRAREYLRSNTARRVAPVPAAVDALRELDEPFPESPTPPSEVLALLDRLGSPATVTTTGGRYFGFVNGGVLPAALAASWLASTWDQNVSLRVMSPAGVAVEDVGLRGVGEILGLSPAGARANR